MDFVCFLVDPVLICLLLSDFDDTALRSIVDRIAHASGQLMEIVNFNVEAEQYVCAGHVRKPQHDMTRQF